ncbi:ABC transporter permease, partial [Klebsiella pneumoniae]|uniref:ABC transporter permease n=1 Tax=Klebsiella pneumoniae TaxID=573 RepID=UPI00226DFD1B
LPAVVLAGFAFASLAMVMTALAPSYDFFMFYQTLVMTPMLLLSGVSFPLSQLPAAPRHVTEWLPLAHAIALIRPAMLGRAIDQPWL